MHIKANDHHLVRCHVCSYAQSESLEQCVRCNAHLSDDYLRYQKSWAWLLVAAIFYIPSMIYPVTFIGYIGQLSPSTLMQSVIYFWHSGSWPVAVIIFVASVFIPCFKILSLAYLLMVAYFKNHSSTTLRYHIRLYRLLEIIGKWSMIDVFVVGILVALVQFGVFATIIPGIGTLCFAFVVVATILSAHYFEPKLLCNRIVD